VLQNFEKFTKCHARGGVSPACSARTSTCSFI